MQAIPTKRYRARAYGVGSQLMLTIGLMLITLMVSVFSIDTGWYFAAQNQLQTATDAAAIAGGNKMFEGAQAAEEAALELGEANEINGVPLAKDNFTFQTGTGSFTVQAEAKVPTIMAKMLCALTNNAKPGEGCDYMTAHAAAKAVGAPRDTILVLDTSSSMDDLGYGQPFKDVKSAAQSFLDMVVQMEADSPDSVDKVAIVKFDKTSSLVNTFTSTKEDSSFNKLKDKIENMTLYSGSGWNTNYQSGLKVAMDEMAAHGRSESHKTIIFFTDGEPNLPEGSTKINTCVSYYNNRKYSSAKTCTQNYVNYMLSQTDTQVQRAKDMEVTIHTIQINDADPGNSLETFRTLLQNKNWEPGLLDSMANNTDGKQFEAENTDGEGIMEIFQTVAKIVNIKLAPVQ